MFCGKCGKELSEKEKFCPQCGAVNPNSSVQRPAPSGKEPAAGLLAVKSPYQLALMAFGALHVPAFFLISYGKLESWMLRLLLAELGSNAASSLTGFNIIQFYGKLAKIDVNNAMENFFTYLVIFGAILAAGLLTMWVNLQGNTKKSYMLSIVFAVIALLGYLFMQISMPLFEDMGCEVNGSAILMIGVTTVQLAMAVLGHSKDRIAV